MIDQTTIMITVTHQPTQFTGLKVAEEMNHSTSINKDPFLQFVRYILQIKNGACSTQRNIDGTFKRMTIHISHCVDLITTKSTIKYYKVVLKGDTMAGNSPFDHVL